MLRRGGAAVVDADGDLAVRLAPGARWDVGVADTIDLDHTIATLRLESPSTFEGAEFGVATSGTSIHRWVSHAGLDAADGGRPTHHLIDPRTGLAAITDVVQATVVARSARVAEAFAKTAVILGSAAALRSLDRPPIDGLLLLTEDRRVLATPRTLRYMA
jgi:thiamine biosynthesis lipoprotein